MDGFCCSFNYHASKEKITLGNSLESHADDFDDGHYFFKGEDMERKTEEEDDVLPLMKSPVIKGSALHCYDHTSKRQIALFPKRTSRILVHDPLEFPETTVASALVSIGEESWLSVAPSLVESTIAVRGIEVSRRQCLFDDELQLSSAETYSFQTCITECRARYLAKLCNCLPFFYPSLYNLSTCTLLDVPCLRKYRRVVASTRPPEGAEGFSSGLLEGMACDECLPACSERSYSVASTLKAPIVAQRAKFAATDSAFTKHYDMTNRSVIHVHFNDIYCIKYRRDAVMTWDGLLGLPRDQFTSFSLAAIGGIFGLCLGGSAISIVELVYFFTMGLWSRVTSARRARKRRIRNRKIHPPPPPAYFLH
ncbi:hypothetical protein J437_LFUL012366 [Ladona fulva]|uniref:Pickpocket protein 28 n=1 Tax=Ladona fulva TaxID=123851 RepID=A0A8K0KCH8_LADFU|nr:hypothetical protein J437_LFUL012366 [Ladona fulva]